MTRDRTFAGFYLFVGMDFQHIVKNKMDIEFILYMNSSICV